MPSREKRRCAVSPASGRRCRSGGPQPRELASAPPAPHFFLPRRKATIGVSPSEQQLMTANLRFAAHLSGGNTTTPDGVMAAMGAVTPLGVHAVRGALRARCAGPHRENWPEVGVPVPARHLRCWRSRRERAHPGGRGPSHPPAYGGLCRPPPGVTGQRSAFPCLRATLRERRRLPDDAWPSAKKLMAANSVRCRRFRGESVKGGLAPPFTKRQLQIGTRRSARQCAREFRFRRAAPGGSRAGPSFQPTRRQSADPIHGPRSRTARPEVAFPAH